LPARAASLQHRSLFQPREPAFWVFSFFVVGGAVVIVGLLSRLSDLSSSGYALSWLLLGLYAVPIFVLMYTLDLYEREPLSLALDALAWGAFAATALSSLAIGWDDVLARALGQDFAVRWGSAITAPLVEESMKAAGIVLIYLIARDEVRDVVDGFVYGALCGLGFAIVEDVLYFMGFFGGSPTDVVRGFYVRVVSSGLYGHVLYTGLSGMAIASVVSRPDVPLPKRLRTAAVLVAAGVGMHALWNSPLLDLVPSDPHGWTWLLYPVTLAVKGLPMIVFVAMAVILARGRERRWLDALASTEFGGAIIHDDLLTLREPRRRRMAVRDMRRRAGAHAARVLRRLHREQITLAMLANRVASPDDPALVGQRAYCGSLRDALEAIPGAAPAGVVGGPPDRSG
jgi:protease PrsW